MNLIWDCDDTLYDLRQPYLRAIKEVQLPVQDLDLNAFYATYRKYGDRIFPWLQCHAISEDESGIYRLLKACDVYGVPCTRQTAEQFQHAYRTFQGEISLSPLMYDFLTTTGHAMAILTNGLDSHQRYKLHALKMDTILPEERLFTSGQLGVAKPDPKAFLTVVSALGGKPEDWTYIGDNYQNDMVGAKQAGMHTIHFNRHHKEEGPCSEKVFYTEEDLVAWLKERE